MVIGIDDLVRAAEREPVRGDEDRDPAGLQDPRGLGDDPLGIGHVFERLHREHRGELAIAERQLAHVGDDRLALLAGQRRRIDVDPDGLARRQQVIAVTDAAAEVEDAPGAEEGRAERVGGYVSLPGGIKAAGRRGDALARDLRGDRRTARCGPFDTRLHAGRFWQARDDRRGARTRARGSISVSWPPVLLPLRPR